MFLKGIAVDSRELSSQIHSRDRRLNVIAGDLSLPLLVLKESALENNLASMAAWSREYGMHLAPHGKTTMCPEIFKRQLAYGAWGMTFAAVSQISAGIEAGFKRILIANQVTGRANLRALTASINTHPDIEFYSFVDSTQGAKLLAQSLRECGALRPLNVFLEWGFKGGRTGVRSVERGREVISVVTAYGESLKLCGFSGFEGIANSAIAVDEFHRGLGVLSQSLSDWVGRERPIISFGGSAYLDLICSFALSLNTKAEVVIRSGCYVTHDHGQYQRMSAAAEERRTGGLNLPQFTPALELWSAVQSVPEEGLALLNFGKRDAAYDLDLPLPLFTIRESDLPAEPTHLHGSKIFKLNDQHAYLEFDRDDSLIVGDLVCCGISHPCTAFDKWRLLPLVDDGYNVIDLYHTLF